MKWMNLEGEERDASGAISGPKTGACQLRHDRRKCRAQPARVLEVHRMSTNATTAAPASTNRRDPST